MRLLRIGRSVWDVVAVVGPGGESVLSQLEAECQQEDGARGGRGMDKRARMAARMIALLRANAPADSLRGTPFSKPLDNGIFEFRIGYGKRYSGPKLRVTYFYGEGRRLIVCAERIWKRGEGMQGAIRSAKRIRRLYRAAHKRGDVQIIDIPKHKEPS